jgi:predicted ATPase
MRVSRANGRGLFDAETGSTEKSARRRIEAINELYNSGKIYEPDQNVLRYFLSRLGSVIEKTKETEAKLQQFVEACNSYLVDSSDEKSFIYEPNSMRVTVVNKFTDSVVPLGQLSSGEKQVVSILARLYLYNKRNFVLIDEPELSLSLDWQRKIIPDMLGSGSIAQRLAITHSPFIFDNELDPFAGAMSVIRHKRQSI